MIKTLKNNIRNKAWWIAVISLIALILQAKGVDLKRYIGEDWQTTLNNVFALLALIGISVNTNNEIEKEVTTDTTETKSVQPELSATQIEQIKTILNQ